MALSAKVETKQDQQGKPETIFKAEFTNGTVVQLQELATFLKNEGLINNEVTDDAEIMKEVLRVGIAFLEGLKERSAISKTEGK